MKRSEVAMTILIASMAMIAAFFITRSLFGNEIKREATIEVAVPLVKDETQGVSISRRIFNEEALNPTVEIYADDNSGSSTQDESEE